MNKKGICEKYMYQKLYEEYLTTIYEKSHRLINGWKDVIYIVVSIISIVLGIALFIYDVCFDASLWLWIMGLLTLVPAGVLLAMLHHNHIKRKKSHCIDDFIKMRALLKKFDVDYSDRESINQIISTYKDEQTRHTPSENTNITNLVSGVLGSLIGVLATKFGAADMNTYLIICFRVVILLMYSYMLYSLLRKVFWRFKTEYLAEMDDFCLMLSEANSFSAITDKKAKSMK